MIELFNFAVPPPFIRRWMYWYWYWTLFSPLVIFHVISIDCITSLNLTWYRVSSSTWNWRYVKHPLNQLLLLLFCFCLV